LSSELARVRLLFVDEGSFYHEEIDIPIDAIGRYERLVDCLQEDPGVIKGVYVDLSRLCSAQLVDVEEA